MVCSVTGCGAKSYALTYCRKHHARFKRHGTTDSKYDKSGYSKLGGVKDIGQGRRGSLAVNVINDIKFKAGKRKLEWHLTHEEAFKLITSQCVYDGYTPDWPNDRVGIDRINSDGQYTPDNVVPCCFTCNSAKNAMSVEQFLEWVKRIHAYQFG